MRHAADLRNVPSASTSSQIPSHNTSRPHAQRNSELEHRNNDGRESLPRNAHGIRLRPTTDLRMYGIIRYLLSTILIMLRRIHPHDTSSLADMYRSLFKFGVFNAVQSKCYDSVRLYLDNVQIASNNVNRLCQRTTIWWVCFCYANTLEGVLTVLF